MNNTVLVPLDGSELAERALPLAASLAQRLKGTLLLLQVVSAWPLGRYETSKTEARVGEPVEQGRYAEEEHYLTEIVNNFVAMGVPARHMLAMGPFAESIVQVADTVDAGYVVMATYGRTGVSRWALGSVTARVLQLIERPLLLLRPSAERPSAPLAPLRRIVVPLDGSPLSAQALPHARALAHLYGAELLLFRALSRVPAMLLSESEVREAWYAQMGDEARSDLSRIVAQLQAEGITARFEIGVEPAADAILAFGQTTNADLMVMASNAHGWLGRALWGSVTDRVVRAGEFPVLVTRAASSSA